MRFAFLLFIVACASGICAADPVRPFHRSDVRVTQSSDTFAIPGDFDGFAVTLGKWHSYTINAGQIVGHMFERQLGMARVKEPGPRTLRIVLSSREQPWVGPKVPQLNALDDEGFVIRVLRDDAGRANGLQFASKSSIGQFWALSYFFHNVVGARWVLPGAVGEVVPPGPWHVPARYEVIHPGPQYQQRSLLTERLYLFKKEKAYGRIQSMLYMNSQGGFSRFQYHHNMLHIFPPARYAAEHPDYYPVANGKRRVPDANAIQGWQPCFTHPDAVRVTLDYAKELFERRPHLRSLSLAPNDSRGYCNCDRCLALGDPTTPLYKDANNASGRTYSRQYYHYVRKVAEAFAVEHPDRLVTVLPYQDVADPPTEPLPDNVICVFFGNPSDQPAHFARWQKTVKHFGMYLWVGSDWVWPGGFSRRDAQQYVRSMRDTGAVLFKAEQTSTYCLGGVNFWVVSNLLWDVNADVDALVRDYCDSAFGEQAGTHIAAFYSQLDDIHERLYPGKLWQQWAPGELQFNGVTDADMASLRMHVNQALATVSDEADQQRLALFDTAFTHVEHFYHRYRIRQDIHTSTPQSSSDVRDWLGRIAELRRAVEMHEAFMRDRLNDLEWYAWVGHENRKKDIVYRINNRYRTAYDRPISVIAEPAIDAINQRINGGKLPADLWPQMALAFPALSDLIDGASAMRAIRHIADLPNLLSNASFEQPLGPLRGPKTIVWGNWVIYHNRNISATVDRSDEGALDGRYCAVIAGATSYSGLHHLMRVKGGHRYLLTGFVRGTDGVFRVSASTGTQWPAITLQPTQQWSRFRLFFTAEGKRDQQTVIWLNLDARKVPGDRDQWFIDDVRLVDLTDVEKQ